MLLNNYFPITNILLTFDLFTFYLNNSEKFPLNDLTLYVYIYIYDIWTTIYIIEVKYLLI